MARFTVNIYIYSSTSGGINLGQCRNAILLDEEDYCIDQEHAQTTSSSRNIPPEKSQHQISCSLSPIPLPCKWRVTANSLKLRQPRTISDLHQQFDQPNYNITLKDKGGNAKFEPKKRVKNTSPTWIHNGLYE